MEFTGLLAQQQQQQQQTTALLHHEEELGDANNQHVDNSTSLSAPPLPTVYSRNTSTVRMHHIRSALSQETQLSLTNRATHLCKCNGVADFPQTLLPHSVTMPSLVIFLQRV